MAHELAHVAQNQCNGAGMSSVICRNIGDAYCPTEEGPTTATPKTQEAIRGYVESRLPVGTGLTEEHTVVSRMSRPGTFY